VYLGFISDLFQRFMRAIQSTDWDRVLLYSSRVKKLTFGRDRGFSEILPTLNVCLSSGLFFPSLSELVVEDSVMDLGSIRFVLGPLLSSLEFAMEPTTTNVSLLSIVPRLCPELKTIAIGMDGDEKSAEMTRVTSAFVLGFRRIDSLAMGIPDPAALAHIGQLPTLTCLRLMSLPNDIGSIHTAHLTFPCLRLLIFTKMDLELATTFFGLCSELALTLFALDFPNFPSLPTIVGFFHALTGAVSHSSLTCLALRSSLHPDEVGPSGAEFSITDRSLRILFIFTDLTRLSLTSGVAFDLTDNTLADAARAWPRLELFGLISLSRTQSTPSNVTLESLRSLATHCRSLSSLSISFDATALPIPSTSIAQHSLIHLDVQLSPIVTPGPVARFLSDIFPGIQQIIVNKNEEPTDPVGRASFRHWKVVRALVPEFVAAREEEKARALA
jgi:hypothetical protein